MKDGRIIRSFSDLRAAIAAVASETPPVPELPMTSEAVEAAARAFVAHRHKAPTQSNGVSFEPSTLEPDYAIVRQSNK